jgi:hypothetical protein
MSSGRSKREKPWYKTTWFKVGAAVTVGSVLLFGVYKYTKNKSDSEERRRREEAEEAARRRRKAEEEDLKRRQRDQIMEEERARYAKRQRSVSGGMEQRGEEEGGGNRNYGYYDADNTIDGPEDGVNYVPSTRAPIEGSGPVRQRRAPGPNPGVLERLRSLEECIDVDPSGNFNPKSRESMNLVEALTDRDGEHTNVTYTG